MRYTVVLEETHEADHPGWYYAHIPTLDLTTHGEGVDGAMAAAKDLVEAWLAELRASGKPVPSEGVTLVSQIDVVEHAVYGS